MTLSKDDKLWAAMSKAARDYAEATLLSSKRERVKMKAAFEAVDLFGAL